MADIRWQQRLSNFERAFKELEEAVELSQARPLTKLEKQGLIQSFEYTHELAWNTLKDFLLDQGNLKITGSKDTTREAFKVDLIKDGESWMKMISTRNLTSHTYNKETAELIVADILGTYFKLFQILIVELNQRRR